VVGVLGIFRRSAVLDVGGFAERMATEDVDLSWRLFLAGRHTACEQAFAISFAGETAGANIPLVTPVLARGVAVAAVCTLQLAFLLGAVFAMLYWMLSAAVAVRPETCALLRGPVANPVAWNVRRGQ
jgi:GT2 family glycosyltransferase